MKNETKQSLVAAARAIGILPALEVCRFIGSKYQSSKQNAAFRQAKPDFAPPPLWWMHDMYRHTSFEGYWRTGTETAAVISEKIDQYVSSETAPCVADWGCGLARVVRHLPPRYVRTGFDYNADAIAWARDHISEISFLDNALAPPLPSSANSFDALYALSVFTHLSEQAHHDWIKEIGRVLKPGGIFLGAFHMRPVPGQLRPAEQLAFDADRLVVRGRAKEGSRIYTAHHPEAFLRNKLFNGFEILEGPTPLFGQELFVVRKPGEKPEKSR